MSHPETSSSAARITPRTLKGFRDYPPEIMIPRERLIDTARRVYRSFGFAPIDTPALEYLDVLTGKGSDETDKQMYRFVDHGGREVGMRFDLTVPLARFAAQHIQELGTPFKRYHIATVWRGENTQRGRYREFMQCDFDTIGVESVTADIETALVIFELLHAIGMPRFTLRLNNRMVLNGLLQRLDLADRASAVLRSLDKLGKLRADDVAKELESVVGLSDAQARDVVGLAALDGDNDAILRDLEHRTEGSEVGQTGVARLREIVAAFEAATGEPGQLRIDPSIARGLDYYTGPIYETFLDELPAIGSICSGGRYDDLAGLFTRQRLPGIGASLGLDRLLAAQEELGLIERVRTPTPILIAFFAADRYHDYLRLARSLRRAGIGSELFPEPRKLGAQLKYADKQGFRAVLILGEDEFQAGTCRIKDLKVGSQEVVHVGPDAGQLVDHLRDLVA
ncbi:MAG: histidine--tRNA ligase [Planctomycetes bacterium]|nr:histidine--tRNA ligase [Planctomycetota bacterium]